MVLAHLKNLRRRHFPLPKTSAAERIKRGLKIESLEERRMLTLNGITPTLPLITYNSTGLINYDAMAQTFDLTATPLVLISPPPKVITPTRDLAIHIQVDNAGNLIGGVPGDDFFMEGNIDMDGDTIPEYSGVLLTGEITQFGFQEAGVNDLYDFRFTVTGGALASLYAGKDIGVTTTSEGSTFNDSFDTNFTGGAKGNIGPVDPVFIPGPLPSSLAGNVYCDHDNDGIKEVGENGIAGVTITLTGTDDLGAPVNLVTATDASGAYQFTALRPGTYTIIETQPAGYFDGKDTIGTPGGSTSNDVFSNVVLLEGIDGTANNFGELGPSSIGGTVYVDLNNNGLFEPGLGETGISGVTVTLTGTDVNGGAVNQVTATDVNGAYNFTNLLTGTYSLTETQPAGFLDGKDTIGTPGGATANDVFSIIVLPACFAGTGNNFGELPTITITGTKYLDVTGNGWTGDDTELGGTTIKLYRDADNSGTRNSGDVLVTTTVSAVGTGFFSFTGLAPGKYFVEEVVPTNYVRTKPISSNYYTVNATTYGATYGDNIFANARACDCHANDLCNVYYVINGCTTVTDLRGNVNEGDVVEVHFTIKVGASPQLYTLVSYTAPGKTFVAEDADEQQIYDVDSGVFGPGTYTLTVFVPNCYFQVDFVCGAAIDHFGPAGSNIFYSAQKRLISADNDGTHSCTTYCNTGSLSGSVYVDSTNDGQIDLGEQAIEGVLIKLTGTDYNGNAITRTTTTNDDGMYFFNNLAAGWYTLTETQPGDFTDGKDSAGDVGGVVTNDKFSKIVLSAGTDASDYNFGERESNTGNIKSCQSATIAYWYGKNGQALIKCLNGGSSSTALGNWLASTFENMFGANCGAQNMAGKTNDQVAKLFKDLYSVSGLKLEAQVLATCLAVYVTDSDLSGTVAKGFGFRVDAFGLGAALASVGTSGQAFGASDNTKITVMELLLITDARSYRGKIYDQNANGSYQTSENNLRTLANSVYTAINAAGGING